MYNVDEISICNADLSLILEEMEDGTIVVNILINVEELIPEKV